METKIVLMNWRDARMTHPTTRRLPFGRLFPAWLLAMLLGWSTGAIADEGYVSTTGDQFGSHPDEPAIQVVRSTYNMTSNLNVYEFKLRYYSYSGNGADYTVTKWGYKGDVWLTIDGTKVLKLSDLIANNTHIGDNSVIELYRNHTTHFTGWDGYANRELASGKANISQLTDVYVSLSNPETKNINTYYYGNFKYKGSGWNISSFINYTKVVTVRVGIERAWNHKNYSIGVVGSWYGGGAYDKNGANTKTDVHEYTMSFDATAPSVTWPSSSGTLKRTANIRVTYTAPSGLSTKSVPQVKSNGDYVNETEYCTFQNNVYLMKSQGNTSSPWSSISGSSKYYDWIENVSSSQTVTFDDNNKEGNYAPLTVYPCWEYKSQNDYFIMPTSSTKYKQSHNKFMTAVTAPGFPRPTNVKVSTDDAFSRKVTVSWGWEVKDDKNCDKNGRWRVFRRSGDDGQTLWLGDKTNGTVATYSFTYAPNGDNLPEYGTPYTYIVCFVPSGWQDNVNSENDVKGLSASTSYTMEQSFSLAMGEISPSEDKISVNWTHDPITDASSTNKYTLELQRSLDGENWTKLETFYIDDPSVNDGHYDDTNISANTSYHYRIRFPSLQGMAWTSSPKAVSSTGSSIVEGSFMASRGNYSNAVKLTWQVKQVGTEECNFALQRRPLGSSDESEWATIYTTHGTARNYSYDDQTAQTGSFNEYKLTLSEKMNGVLQVTHTATTDGFCMAFGTMSGRVSFGSGTAVDSVKVTMRPQDTDGNSMNHFRSLYLNGASGSGLRHGMTAQEIKNLFGNDFTIQMWLNPDGTVMSAKNKDYELFDIPSSFSLKIKSDNKNNLILTCRINNDTTTVSTDTLKAGQWSHLTVVYSKGSSKNLNLYLTDEGRQFRAKFSHKVQTISNSSLESASAFGIGNWSDLSASNPYAGYIDEVRIFTRALTEQEILRNCSHPLVGSENGLKVYYSLDEGLYNQKIAYDFSKQNGVSNGHHSTMKVAAQSSTIIPSEDQFSLMGYTDAQGNYMVGGIPFSGDGTNYVVTPTLGIHQFSPANQSRFFSNSSLVQTGVDFEDVSSFPVSGMVYYDGTTIPVEGASLYVDGNLASKDGEAVSTNADGEFTVDVPIGDHFIQVKKEGHTFVKNGRYPEDTGIGNRTQFKSKVEGLTFYDNTRVTVAGRVAGGDIEFDKPLGLQQGFATIGQAELTLSYANSAMYDINLSGSRRNFDASTPNIVSQAYVENGKNVITILTDPEKGEWAAELLPLHYTVEKVKIISNESIKFSSLPTIDATNPVIVYTDTLPGSSEEFKYVASAKIRYKTPTQFHVTEHSDGSFGEQSIDVTDLSGNTASVSLYTVENGQVDYTYGSPIYKEGSDYTYRLQAYEEYENRDTNPATISTVPLANAEVTIENQFSTAASVYIEGNSAGKEEGEVAEIEANTFNLDDNGEAVYTFTAGFPNVKGDYTRGISISYENNGTKMSWDGNGSFRAIVLGSLTTGNQFVTQAPDQLTMILRDPPGSGSSATYTKGSTRKVKGYMKVSSTQTDGVDVNNIFKLEQETITGIGVATSVKSKVGASVDVDFEAKTTVSTDNTWVHEITTKHDISTSDAKGYVGPDADIFIGTSKNLIFGTCHRLHLKKDESSSTPKYDLVVDDAMETGMKFNTEFFYTQKHIEKTLLPNYLDLRNSLLTYVADINSVARPEEGQDPIYISKVPESDPRFGSSNSDRDVWGDAAMPISMGLNMNSAYVDGPSYRIILPKGMFASNNPKANVVQDMVDFYNKQIKGWIRELAKNEEMKVTAIQNRDEYLNKNYSFDAGIATKYSYEESNTDSHSFEFNEDISVVLDMSSEATLNGVGTEITITVGEEVEATAGTEVENEESTCFTYELEEGGAEGYLTVDIFDAPDNFGPIFYTKAGATSCPYEDEVVTKYYQPGTKIGEKTAQIEKPEIEPLTQVITGIPAGSEATMKVILRNNSETNKDRTYVLSVQDGTNPDGLQVLVDGMPINTGRSIKVSAKEDMVKTFVFKQSNPDKLEYENIGLVIASDCQGSIKDVKTVSVYFQPTCSDIHLVCANNNSTRMLVNTETEETVTLSISGYNYSMASLQGVRLEYKGENDINYHLLQEYSKDASLVAANPLQLKLLPELTGSTKLEYEIDLRDKNFSDQTYVFRAVTVCMQSDGEVNNESEEITIVRDMTRPQLIATPTPASGILGIGNDLTITFNEDIQNGILSKAKNFEVVGELNETEVAHDVALSLTGENSAKTDATIDLSGKSFSASMWLNYSSNGRLLQHGTADNNFTVAIEEGKLAVTVAGEKVVSGEPIPASKWIYLNVSYDAEKKELSAGYASDDSDELLISNVKVPAYEGNGPVSMGGNNLTAKVQELAIWNSARSMAEAQGEMYTTKSQFTNGLMGYWQLNEGRGDVATDRARSRNMTLPSQNAWWIDGDNYALTLDGGRTVAANIGDLNTMASEDYLVEAWFKADEDQHEAASILSTRAMDLRLNADGQMELSSVSGVGNAQGSVSGVGNAQGSVSGVGNAQSSVSGVGNAQSSVSGVGNATYTTVYDSNLRDGQWHHVAVNVLKSTNGSGSVYVDGVQRKQLSASIMPIFYGDQLMLGGRRVAASTGYEQLLKGAIDEVRVWKARRTADVIKNNMYNRLKGDEAGLVAYYPMEATALDEYNQKVTSFTDADKATPALSEGDESTQSSGKTLSVINEYGESVSTMKTSENTAALKLAPSRENVTFSFVASERQIKVNLTESAYKLEGCNVYITAKNVKDVHGNSAEPITWSVYVQQNNLRWQENSIDVTKEGTDEQTFTATIENRGSESENWSLNGLPTWLSANTESGTLSPLATQKLTFTVAGSLPIGTYETTVYMTGSQAINAPLNITVNSEGEAPDWTVIPGESTMSVVGVLEIDGVQSSDPKDMVAAFRGTECVGVAQPKYFSRYDSYIVMMSIYGNEEAELTYKAYDASTGTVYPSVSVSKDEANTFTADKTVGTFTLPVKFKPLNEIEQDLSMDRAAWKWFSLYAKPKTNKASVVFKDAIDDISTVSDGDNSVIGWTGELAFNYSKMFKVCATAPYKELLVGEPTNPDSIDITLNSNGWTWLGYPCQAMNSLDAAFASVAQDGDQVKSQTAFSIYTGGEWIGTLTAMVPGEGYMYENTTSTTKTFSFPKPAVSGKKNAPAYKAYETHKSYKTYKDNMTMIAVVMDGETLLDDVQVSVYAGTEMRAFSADAVRDGRHFLTIGGEGGEPETLTFVVTTANGEYVLAKTMTFVADAKHGTMDKPVVLNFSESTGISEALFSQIKSIMLYDGSGRLVRSAEAPARMYNRDDLKGMPTGVYYQQVTYSNGMTRVQKLMR